MMKFLNHIKLAAFTGLLVGILHGTIDIIARLIVWSFEWFELYQTLFLSTVFFTVAFLLFGILLHLLIRTFKFKFSKKSFRNFYFSTSFVLLLLFYIQTIVNRDILYDLTFFHPKSLLINTPIIALIALFYIILLFKGRELVEKLLTFSRKSKIKSIIKNYIFAVIVFITASFFIDIYLLNYVPTAIKSDIDSPNIILMSLDTIRADHLASFGYKIQTSPNLDKLAEESLVFENAIASGVWSILSHVAIMTGKYVSNFDPEHTNEGIRKQDTTLAEILRKNGYNTVGIIASSFMKAKFGFGQGFANYQDRMDFFEHELTYNKFSVYGAIFTFLPFSKNLVDPYGLRTSEQIDKQAFKWLEKNHKNPFFMFVHYDGAHRPYTPAPEFRELFTNDTRDYWELEAEYERTTGFNRYGNVSKDVVASLVKLYDAEIYDTDYHVGLFVDKMKELGIFENTILIVLSDHGEEFYDHGYFKHGRTLYQESNHIPLIIHYPREFKAKRIKETVGTIDIYPTILEFLNIDVPGNIDGISFLPLITGKGNYSREVLKSEIFGLPGQATKKQIAIYKGDWKLIEIFPDVETIPSGLYNLRTDPKEQRNLYDVFPQKRDELKKYVED